MNQIIRQATAERKGDWIAGETHAAQCLLTDSVFIALVPYEWLVEPPVIARTQFRETSLRLKKLCAGGTCAEDWSSSFPRYCLARRAMVPPRIPFSCGVDFFGPFRGRFIRLD